MSACTNVVPNVQSLSVAPASVRIISPSTGTYFNSATAVNVGLSGACVSDADVTISGDFVSSPLSATCSSGVFSATVSLTSIDGDKVLGVAQQATTTNAAASSTVMYTLDTDLPDITITSPASAFVTNSTSLTVQGTCETGRSVRVYDNSAGGDVTAAVNVNCAGGIFSAPITFTATETVKTVVATQADAAGNSSSASVAYVYDKPDITFVSAGSSVSESAGTHTVGVSLSAANGKATIVDYAVNTSAAFAASSADYTLANGKLTFAPGQVSQTILLTLLPDSIYEPITENVTIELSNAVGGVIATSSHVVNLLDDDPLPVITISAAGATVGEGTATHTITLGLTNPSAQNITLDYYGASGAATLGSDFTLSASPVTLTFAAGVTTRTFTVPIANDAIYEGDEDFYVNLQSAVNATLTGTPFRVTIGDNETQPLVGFDQITQTSTENGGTQNVLVRLSGVASAPVYIDYVATNGTATVGGDFSVGGGGTLMFAAGSTTAPIPISFIDDGISEPDESFDLTLSNVSANATLKAGFVIQAHNITDDESLPSVRFASATSSASESVTPHAIEVTLSGLSSQQTTIVYSVAAGGTATSGTDFTLATGTLTFAPGSTSQMISVDVVNDAIGETNETIKISLSGPSSGITLGAPVLHTHTVMDDDLAAQIYFTSAASSSAESVGTQLISVNLTSPEASTVTVDYQINAASTATSGVDHGLINGQLVFSPGVVSQNISVPVINDLIGEPDETLVLNLSNVTGGVATLDTGNATHTYTITGNDVPTVRFLTASSSVLENTAGGTYTITAELSNPNYNAVTVPYGVIAASPGTATAGSDYSLLGNNLTFAAGSTVQSFVVNITNDTIYESDEIVNFELGIPSANATLGAITTQALTISNDDTIPAAQFVQTTSAASEAVATHSWEVVLNHGADTPIQVSYSVSGTASASGVDFTLANGTLTFSPGAVSQFITAAVVNDSFYDGPETIVTSLSPLLLATIGANSSHTHTITDDETIPTVQFSSDASNMSEATTPHIVNVNLNHATQTLSTVNYFISGTAVNGVDFNLSNGTLSFAAFDTSEDISIPIIDDAIADAAETIVFTLAAPSGVNLGSTTVHVHTISDNEGSPEANFANATSNAAESVGTVNIPVNLTVSPSAQVLVAYSVSGTAQGSSVDYSGLNATGTLTFAAGDLSEDISLNVIDDSLGEPAEAVIVTLTSVSGAGATLGSTQISHTYTITASDTPTVDFDLTSNSTTENIAGGLHNVFVKISNAASADVIVTYSSTDGTATHTAPIDYTMTAGSATILAGQTVASIAVNIDDDVLSEGDQNFSASLVSVISGNAILAGINNPMIVTITDNEPKASFSFLTATDNASENVGTRNIVVQASYASDQAMSVDYSISGAVATGGGVDYTLPAGTLNFAAGVLSQNIALTIASDTMDEPDESLTLGLANALPSAIAQLGTFTSQTFTITDDDATPTVQFNLATSNASEATSPIAVVLNLNRASSVATSVNYTVTGTASGTGTDYTLANGTVNFASPQTVQTISLPIVQDAIAESNETVTITLATPSGLSLGSVTVHTHTIADDDVQPFTWMGATGDNSWSTAGNWSTGVVPTSTDTAIFNGACVGTNCNVTLPSVTTVAGLDVQPAYGAHVMTLGANTLNVTNDFSFASGTFSISTGTLTVGNFYQTAGTFTLAGAATLNLNGAFSTAAPAVTNLSTTSTVKFQGANAANVSILNGLYFSNLIFNKPGVTISGDDLNVTGNVTLTSCAAVSNALYLKTLTTQTLTGTTACGLNYLEVDAIGAVNFSGSIRVSSNYYYLNGAPFNSGTSTLIFPGSSSVVLSPNSVIYNNVTFSKTAAVSISLDTNFEIAGALALNGSGTTDISGANLNVSGSTVTASAAFTGSSVVRFVGSTSQTVSGSTFPNIEVAMSGGTFSYSGAVSVNGNFTVTSASSLSSGANILAFSGASDCTVTASGALNLGHMQIQKSSTGGMNFVGNVQVNDLTLSGTSSQMLKSGTVHASGSISRTASATQTVSTGEIDLVGSSAQTITATNGLWWVLNINKTAGTIVSPAANLNMHGKDVKLQGGVFDQLTYDVTQINQLTIAAGAKWVQHCKTLQQTLARLGSGLLVTGNEVSLGINNPANIVEGANAVFTVTSTPVNCEPIAFTWSTTDGTATTASSDYTAVPALTAATLPTTGSTSLTVATSADAVYESTENFTVNLSYTGGNGISLGTSTGTINMTNLGSAPTVQFSTATSTDLESVSPILTITLSSANAVLTTVDYTLSGTATGAGTDYTLAAGQLTFSPLQTSKTLTIAVNNDLAVESDESIIVTLSNPTGAVTLGTPVAHTHTITDNDAPFTWLGTTGDGKWSTAGNWSSMPGASDIAKFTSTCGANCNVTIDTATNVAGIDMQSTYTGTISQSAAGLTVGASGFTLAGGTFAGAGGQAITISGPYAQSGGTFTASTQTITFGGDITRTGGTLTLAGSSSIVSGTGTATISIAPSTFNSLTLSKTMGVTIVGNTSVNGILILNSAAMTVDGANLLVAGNLTAAAASGGTSTIQLNGGLGQTIFGSDGGVLPNLALAAAGNITLNGHIDISRNLSYTGAGAVIAGTSTVEFEGSAVNTTLTLVNPLSLYNVKFSKTGGMSAAVSGANALTVTNNLNIANCATCALNSTSTTNEIRFAGNLTIDSGNGGTAYLKLNGTGTQIITRNGGTLPAGTVTVAKASGLVRSGSTLNFSGAGQDIVFSSAMTWDMAGNSLTVSDKIDGSSGTASFYKGCGTLTYGGIIATVNQYTDNYGLTISLASTASATEAASHTMAVSLSAPNCQATAFSYHTTSGTAISGADFTAASGAVSFTTGQTLYNLSVSTLTDALDEIDEYYTMTIDGLPLGMTTGNLVSTATIVDDDGAPTINIAGANVNEGIAAVFVVTLSAPSGQSVTFNYATSDGTATTANSDYTNTSGALTFSAGVTTLNISVPTTAGTVYEGAENFTVSLSAISNAVAGTISNTAALKEIGIQVSGVSASNVTYQGFDAQINFIDDNDANATLTLKYCDQTVTPGCTPSTSLGAMVRGSGIFTKTVTGLALYGHTIKIRAEPSDAGGVSFSTYETTLTFPDPTPVITSITSTKTNASYSNGDTIDIQVNFNLAVNVSGGPPTLTLNTTPARPATYISGGGTATWNFTYVIQDGDYSADLDISSINANGGTYLGTAAPTFAVNFSSIATTLATNKNLRINPRPHILATTCMYEAYAGESYVGCSFSFNGASDTGDTGAVFSLAAGHTCSWFTIGSTGTINASGDPTGTATVIPANAPDRCEVKVTMTDGTHSPAVDFTFPVRVHSKEGFGAVAQSGFHGCAITDGRLKCWGYQSSAAYALGDGGLTGNSNYLRYIFPRVSSGGVMISESGVAAIDIKTGGAGTGDGFSCARYNDSTLSCWGYSAYGEAGYGSTTALQYANQRVQSSAANLTGVMSYDTGGYSSCAIVQNTDKTLTGQIKCWGRNNLYQLGDGTTTDGLSAVSVVEAAVAIKGAVQVSVGQTHACAVLGDGRIKCWGLNSSGQLGFGDAVAYTVPKIVAGYDANYRAVRVMAGDNHTCAISSAGKIKCWGKNDYGQVGANANAATYPNPSLLVEVPFANSDPAIDIALGAQNTCALFDSGSARYARCWGSGTFGANGNMSPVGNHYGLAAGDTASLTRVLLGTDSSSNILEPREITMAKGSVCAVVGVGTARTGVKCWGYNSNGQLGNGSTVTRGTNAVGSEMDNSLPYAPLNPTIYVSSTTVAANSVYTTGLAQCVSDAAAGSNPASSFATVMIAKTGVGMTTIYPSTIPIRLGTSGLDVATNTTDMFDGSVSNYINWYYNTSGATNIPIWSGTGAFGAPLTGYTCNDWTSSSAGVNGSYGNTNYNTSSGYIYASTAICSSSTARVYCYLP